MTLAATLRPLALVGLCLTTACATFEGPSPTRITDSRLGFVPTLRASTSLEREEASRAAPSDETGKTTKGPTKALFVAGIIIGAIGAAGLISMSAASYGLDRKLDNGYAEGITREDAQTLVDRGKALNTGAIVSASVGLAGFLTAITTYGVDYTRCGPLAPKRRRCDER
ncbi:MAG: hypothetical protein R3B09_14725 [Nannocystaceae bacterium]